MSNSVILLRGIDIELPNHVSLHASTSMTIPTWAATQKLIGILDRLAHAT